MKGWAPPPGARTLRGQDKQTLHLLARQQCKAEKWAVEDWAEEARRNKLLLIGCPEKVPTRVFWVLTNPWNIGSMSTIQNGRRSRLIIGWVKEKKKTKHGKVEGKREWGQVEDLRLYKTCFQAEECRTFLNMETQGDSSWVWEGKPQEQCGGRSARDVRVIREAGEERSGGVGERWGGSGWRQQEREMEKQEQTGNRREGCSSEHGDQFR